MDITDIQFPEILPNGDWRCDVLIFTKDKTFSEDKQIKTIIMIRVYVSIRARFAKEF